MTDTRLYLPMTDEALLLCVTKGDDSAFTVLHDRHRAAMSYALEKWLPIYARRPPDLAEDILQETFLAVAHATEAVMNVEAWLWGTMWQHAWRLAA